MTGTGLWRMLTGLAEPLRLFSRLFTSFGPPWRTSVYSFTKLAIWKAWKCWNEWVTVDWKDGTCKCSQTYSLVVTHRTHFHRVSINQTYTYFQKRNIMKYFKNEWSYLFTGKFFYQPYTVLFSDGFISIAKSWEKKIYAPVKCLKSLCSASSRYR